MEAQAAAAHAHMMADLLRSSGVGACTCLLLCTRCAGWVCPSLKTSRCVIKHVLLLLIMRLLRLLACAAQRFSAAHMLRWLFAR